VRLKAHVIGEVKVLSGKHAHQPVAECNCVVVRRGGEQQEANDSSVGKQTRFGQPGSASLLGSGEA